MPVWGETMGTTREPTARGNCQRCFRPLAPGTRECAGCGAAVPGSQASPFERLSARDAHIGQIVAGRFRIDELIGQGGMGRVYRARHLALDRDICLKMLKTALLEDPTLVGRFEREAKAASRLNHPNVIQVLDFGRNERDGELFIAMEHVPGQDLRALLRDEWPIPEARLARILAQVCAALSEAHAHQVIHRDLKPENIMVEQRRDGVDRVKVLDFGIAKILDSDMPGLTRSDVVCGTPQYMAPEQATGSALDPRCDLYAVGVILYQMTTGQLPFDGTNSMEVLTRHVNEPPVPPRQRAPAAPISEAMEALILRALSKDPLQRPQTAEEFQGLLLGLADGPGPERLLTPPRLTPASATPPVAAPRSAGMAGLAIGLVAALVAALATALVLGRRAAHASGTAVAEAAAASPRPAHPPDPQRSRELVLRAGEWQAANDTGTARDLLEQAIEADPSNAEAHYRLGGLFLNSQPARARAEYETAKRLNAARYGETVDAILRSF